MSEVAAVNEVQNPVWGASRPSLLALRVAAGESPEWIAARTDSLLCSLQSAFDVSSWQLAADNGWELWEGSPDELVNIVRKHPVREFVGASEDIGDALPGEGYSFTISGAGPRVSPLVRIAAGHPAVGQRLPRRRLAVELREAHENALRSVDADAVTAAVVETWEPATTEFADLAVRRLARRGNWKIGVGYRMWISAEVGTVSHLVDRLTATELAGGTLISAPDDWPAERVVEAMTATLRENGLDEVSH